MGTGSIWYWQYMGRAQEWYWFPFGTLLNPSGTCLLTCWYPFTICLQLFGKLTRLACTHSLEIHYECFFHLSNASSFIWEFLAKRHNLRVVGIVLLRCCILKPLRRSICFIGWSNQIIMKVQNSTFERSPMLGSAELSAVAGSRVARLDNVYIYLARRVGAPLLLPMLLPLYGVIWLLFSL